MNPVYNTSSSEFGRTYFLEEVTNRQIASTNRAIKSKGNHQLLIIRGRIEDIGMAKELGITLKELNQNRMIG